jgi:hypothetical protein
MLMSKRFSIPKDFKWLVLASIIAFVLYMSYFFLLGIRTTTARNELNLGIRYYDIGNYTVAMEHFNSSLNYWDSKEAHKYVSQTLPLLQSPSPLK